MSHTSLSHAALVCVAAITAVIAVSAITSSFQESGKPYYATLATQQIARTHQTPEKVSNVPNSRTPDK